MPGQEAMGTNCSPGGSLSTPGAVLRCAGAGALAQAAQRLWDLLLGGLRKPPGRGPEHPALGGPAAAGLGLGDPEGPACLSHAGILLSIEYDSLGCTMMALRLLSDLHIHILKKLNLKFVL